METILLTRDSRLDATALARKPPPASGIGQRPAVAAAQNLALAFWHAAESRPQLPAVIAREQCFSYAWLRTAAWTVQRCLRSHADFQPGSLVALLLENSPEYLAAFYGVLLADGVVVPLPPQIERARWQHVCASCQPVLAISRPEDLREGLVEPTATALELSAACRPAEEMPAPQRGGQDLAMLLFTSGSTGAPKGVMLSHRNLLANTQSILEYLPLQADDRALVVLPFYHAFGNSVLQTHALAGATLVLDGSLTFPVSLVEALRTYRATSFSGVPEIYTMLLRFGRLGEFRLPELRYMTVAGGAFPPDLAQQLARYIAPARFYVMYGQSEATARLSYLPPEELAVRWGSIGKGIPRVELSVVDERGDPVRPGQLGMLRARGDNVMLGYWQDPGETAAVLQAGWLHTGDLATVDKDDYVYLRGRASLLVKIQGHRVHPGEVEEVLRGQYPGAQVAVLPFQQAGATRLALFLTPPAGRSVSEQDVREVCLRELPRHKLPSHVEVLDRLPLSAALKVDRQALAGRLTSLAKLAS